MCVQILFWPIYFYPLYAKCKRTPVPSPSISSSQAQDSCSAPHTTVVSPQQPASPFPPPSILSPTAVTASCHSSEGGFAYGASQLASSSSASFSGLLQRNRWLGQDCVDLLGNLFASTNKAHKHKKTHPSKCHLPLGFQQMSYKFCSSCIRFSCPQLPHRHPSSMDSTFLPLTTSVPGFSEPEQRCQAGAKALCLTLLRGHRTIFRQEEQLGLVTPEATKADSKFICQSGLTLSSFWQDSLYLHNTQQSSSPAQSCGTVQQCKQ